MDFSLSQCSFFSNSTLTPLTQQRNNTLIKQLHLGRLENMPSIDPKRSQNEDSGVATNNERNHGVDDYEYFTVNL